MEDDAMQPGPGTGRRGALKTLLALGVAAPLVIFSYPGLTVPAALLQQISAGQAAGVIFFGGNISGDAQIASVIQQLRQAQQQSPVSSPLLLMTDQEGGEVRRLPGASAMSEKQIGLPRTRLLRLVPQQITSARLRFLTSQSGTVIWSRVTGHAPHRCDIGAVVTATM
jgi:Glycosyl hydrolase family 3 N terminal domain